MQLQEFYPRDNISQSTDLPNPQQSSSNNNEESNQQKQKRQNTQQFQQGQNQPDSQLNRRRMRGEKVIFSGILTIIIYYLTMTQQSIEKSKQLVIGEKHTEFRPRIILFEQINNDTCFEIQFPESFVGIFQYNKKMKVCADVIFQIGSEFVPMPLIGEWQWQSLSIKGKVANMPRYEAEQSFLHSWSSVEYNAANKKYQAKIDEYTQKLKNNSTYIDNIQNKAFLNVNPQKYLQYLGMKTKQILNDYRELFTPALPRLGQSTV